MTHRTLRDATARKDSSNETLLFHRTMEDAGLRGSFERDEPHGIVVFIFGLIGALCVWMLVTLLLGMEP